jgi:hypothetical protein
MKSSRALLVGAIFGVVTFIAPPANAGGGSWFINGHDAGRAVVVAGEQVEVRANVWLGENGRGEEGEGFHAGPEHGPFYFYVVGREGEDWGPFPPPLPETAIYVADVEFGSPERYSVPAGATFTMPELEPGAYSLLHCNDPCTRQLGDLMSTPFTLVEDGSEARLTERFDKLERRLFDQDQRVGNEFRIVRRDLSSEFRELRSEVTALRRRITAIEERPEAERLTSGFAEGGLAAGAVIVLLVAFHYLSTRRRHH